MVLTTKLSLPINGKQSHFFVLSLKQFWKTSVFVTELGLVSIMLLKENMTFMCIMDEVQDHKKCCSVYAEVMFQKMVRESIWILWTWWYLLFTLVWANPVAQYWKTSLFWKCNLYHTHGRDYYMYNSVNVPKNWQLMQLNWFWLVINVFAV